TGNGHCSLTRRFGVDRRNFVRALQGCCKVPLQTCAVGDKRRYQSQPGDKDKPKSSLSHVFASFGPMSTPSNDGGKRVLRASFSARPTIKARVELPGGDCPPHPSEGASLRHLARAFHERGERQPR